MMALYRRIETRGGVLLGYRRTTDGAIIPLDSENVDYQIVLDWLNTGNTPDPADPFPPLPAAPNYGADVDTDDVFWQNAQTAVTNLRTYIAADTPTAAQTVAVVKLLCRIVLFFIRRSFPTG